MEKELDIRDLRHKEKFIIDDAYLNGYAKLCGIYSTGVYISLCRHADKNQKAFPSLKKISEELNISIKQVGRAIKILESFNIIKKERIGKKANNRYYLLDKSVWTISPIINNSDKTTSLITMDYQSNHIGTDSPIHSKDTQYKDTHSKDSNANCVAGKDINNLIELFKEVNPSYEILFKNKTQRAALERMVKKWGYEKMESGIKFLPNINGRKYAPTITTPIQFENKFGELLSYIKKERSEITIAKIK